jgi:hypothetical protein
MRRTNKSGGRQPAVVGKPNAVRRKSPTIRRRCDRRTRAAGVSPPWYRKRICNGDRLFRTQHVRPGTVGFHPTAGLRQPLLVARRVFRAECDICDAQTHERRASARRGSVNRTRCGENRPHDDDATHEQERRASARRGTGKRICNGDRLFRAQRVPPDTIAFHPTAGLRQPLLVASADAVADVRFVSASPLPIPTAGLRQPLLVARRVFRAECDICDAQTHVHTRAAGVSPPWSVNRTQCGENRPPFDDDATHEQERRASARRGTGKRICNGDRLFRPSTFAPAWSVSIPRLAYTSRSWLPARMLLRMCVSYPKVRYPFPRLAYTSRSWLRDIQRFDCRAYPTGHKTSEPFFHPNRIKTTTLYPTGRGAARTYSEKQSHLRGPRLRVSSGVAESLERKRKSEHPDGGSSR